MSDTANLTGAQKRLQRLLRQHLLDRSYRNSSYSLRAMARDIGISPATLSGFLTDKRSISLKLAKKALKVLDLDDSATNLIIEDFDEDIYIPVDLPDPANLLYMLATLALLEINDARSDARWIAERLQITPQMAEDLLAKLSAHQMVTVNENGSYTATGERFVVGGKEPNFNMHKHFLNTLAVSKAVIESMDNHDRWATADTSQLFMAVDSSKIDEVKNRIKKFRRELASYFEAGTKDSVYMLAINLMPLTKNKPRRKHG